MTGGTLGPSSPPQALRDFGLSPEGSAQPLSMSSKPTSRAVAMDSGTGLKHGAGGSGFSITLWMTRHGGVG